METLKIEHIAPYLPYGLKVQRITKLAEQIGTEHETDIMEVDKYGGDFLEQIIENSNKNWSAKPLLTKELSEEQKENIAKIIFDENELEDVNITYIMDDWHNDLLHLSPSCNLKVLDYLNSIHYDYRGLIDKGLAISKTI